MRVRVRIRLRVKVRLRVRVGVRVRPFKGFVQFAHQVVSFLRFGFGSVRVGFRLSEAVTI